MKSGKKILTADFLLIVICLFGVYEIEEKPDLPITILNNNSELIINSVYDSVYSYLKGGTILNVNDVRVDNINSLEFLLDGYRIGDAIKITVDKGTKIINANLTLIPYYNIGYILIVLITGLLTFLLALLAYFKSTDVKNGYINF